MATLRLLWTAVWVAFMTAGTTSQLYDELPMQALEEAGLFKEDSELDTGPHGVEQTSETNKDTSGDTDGAKALLLIKIIQALRMRNENPVFYLRIIPESVDFVEYAQNAPGGPQLNEKATMVKRLTGDVKPREVKVDVVKSKSTYQPQRRWKSKKGSQMLCYFKLCAFRPLS